MEGREEEKVVGKRALHRHCRQSSVSLSIPSVTLQLSAPTYSIPIRPAHAHTHTARCLHMERRGRREREGERGAMRRKGGGEGEQSACCANAEIPCCRRLTQNVHWNTSTSTHTEGLATAPTSTRTIAWVKRKATGMGAVSLSTGHSIQINAEFSEGVG